MPTVVGFAFLWLTVTPVGKPVFLIVVAAIPNAMLRMTTTAGMVQKAAGGRKKSPPLAVKKQLIVSPSLTLPMGRALKNYRYFHFIGVVRRHYRAFTRRSGYDVW